MKVTYIQHSGFMVECEESVLVFDYYRGMLPPVSKDKSFYVFASHSHGDHFQQEIFDWEKDYPRIHYILSDDIQAETAANRLFLGPDEECGLGDLRIKTLRSTDEGVAFFVSVQDGGQIRNIYHAGDLNWWHWEEEGPEYNEKMKRDYQAEIGTIEGEHIDLAFVPLDPRLEEAYGWGIDYFMRHTETIRLFPMHLWGGYKTIPRFIADPLSEDYRDRIVKIERRQQSFEMPLGQEGL